MGAGPVSCHQCRDGHGRTKSRRHSNLDKRPDEALARAAVPQRVEAPGTESKDSDADGFAANGNATGGEENIDEDELAELKRRVQNAKEGTEEEDPGKGNGEKSSEGATADSTGNTEAPNLMDRPNSNSNTGNNHGEQDLISDSMMMDGKVSAEPEKVESQPSESPSAYEMAYKVEKENEAGGTQSESPQSAALLHRATAKEENADALATGDGNTPPPLPLTLDEEEEQDEGHEGKNSEGASNGNAPVTSAVSEAVAAGAAETITEPASAERKIDNVQNEQSNEMPLKLMEKPETGNADHEFLVQAVQEDLHKLEESNKDAKEVQDGISRQPEADDAAYAIEEKDVGDDQEMKKDIDEVNEEKVGENEGQKEETCPSDDVQEHFTNAKVSDRDDASGIVSDTEEQNQGSVEQGQVDSVLWVKDSEPDKKLLDNDAVVEKKKEEPILPSVSVNEAERGFKTDKQTKVEGNGTTEPSQELPEELTQIADSDANSLMHEEKKRDSVNEGEAGEDDIVHSQKLQSTASSSEAIPLKEEAHFVNDEVSNDKKDDLLLDMNMIDEKNKEEEEPPNPLQPPKSNVGNAREKENEKQNETEDSAGFYDDGSPVVDEVDKDKVDKDEVDKDDYEDDAEYVNIDLTPEPYNDASEEEPTPEIREQLNSSYRIEITPPKEELAELEQKMGKDETQEGHGNVDDLKNDKADQEMSYTISTEEEQDGAEILSFDNADGNDEEIYVDMSPNDIEQVQNEENSKPVSELPPDSEIKTPSTLTQDADE